MPASSTARSTWRRRVPRGFIPTLDQGYAIVVVQLPDGASLARTDAVVQQRVRDHASRRPACRTPSPSPASPARPSPTPRTPPRSSPRFKPFEERAEAGPVGERRSSAACSAACRRSRRPSSSSIPPPPVRGLGNAGGFKMQLAGAQRRRRAPGPCRVADEIDRQAPTRTPSLDRRVHHLLGANAPQIYLEIDRDKARMLNVPIAEHLRDAADQSRLGLRQRLQLPSAASTRCAPRPTSDFRMDREDILRLKVRSADRRAGAARHARRHPRRRRAGPRPALQHVPVGAACRATRAPGVSSGQALDAMEAPRRADAAAGHRLSSGPSSPIQERSTGNTAIFIFGLVGAVRVPRARGPVRELVAAARHHPDRADVPAGGARRRAACAGMDNNILTQIGLVVLVGLAAKNAILIVEFAQQARGATAGRRSRRRSRPAGCACGRS